MTVISVIRHLVTNQVAIKGIVTILSLVVVFHFLVLFDVIPFEIVWGGRLKSSSEMISFELVSICINLLLLVIVGIYSGFLKIALNKRIIKIGVWLMFTLFVLNTVGNLFSNNQWEKIIFTPLTLLLAIFSLRLALNKDDYLA
jgi:hypothetical protein